jgi:hypothetical protein
VLRDGGGGASHVLVLSTLGAPQRRRLRRARRSRPARPEPAAISTARVTVVDAAAPFAGHAEAGTWLDRAGEDEVARDLAVLNRILHAHRVAVADPHVNPVSRRQALVARIGFGSGEEVALGDWTQARELIATDRRQRRVAALTPGARLAAMLAGRDRALVCEELALRARLDLDQGREREGALQVLVALDAALAELQSGPQAAELAARLDELRTQRDPIARAAQAALGGPLSGDERASVAFALERIEAVLRARAAATSRG